MYANAPTAIPSPLPDPDGLAKLALIVSAGSTLKEFNETMREATRARVVMLKCMLKAQGIARRLVAAGLPFRDAANLYDATERELTETCRRLVKNGSLELCDPVFTGVTF